MAIPVLAVHERIGFWGRQLRCRLSDRVVHLAETRSVEDLERALIGAICPLILIDLGQRVRAGLAELDRALLIAPDALSLVLDPHSNGCVSLVARELGATYVISGPVTPLEVAELMGRWLSIAHERTKIAGWSLTPLEPSESVQGNGLGSPIRQSPTEQRTTGD